MCSKENNREQTISMNIRSHTNSLFNSMSYAIGDSVIIDPGDMWNGFNNVEVVLLTHAHFDHIYGLNDLIRISPEAIIYTNEIGREMLFNAKKNLSAYNEIPFIFENADSVEIVNDSDSINIGDDLLASAVFTPGHNPSSITWIIGDAVFSGDSYIPGIKTVTNLPNGNKAHAIESEKLIMDIARNKRIYPGHKI